MKIVTFYVSVLLFSFSVLSAQEGWRKVNVYPHCVDLNAIDNNESLILAVGDFGVIRSSHDYGSTWETYQTDNMEVLLDVSIYDENTAVAVGYKGTVFITQDEAKTWEKIDLNTEETLYNVQYYGKEYGIICGLNGAIFESQGDITDWEKLALNTSSRMNESIIFSKDDAIICGDQGTLCVKKKGTNWESINLGTKADLKRIVKYNDSTAFIITSDFEGFYSIDRGSNWEKVAIDNLYGDRVSKTRFVDVVDNMIVIHASSSKESILEIEYISYNLKSWKRIIKGDVENGSSTRDLVYIKEKASSIAVGGHGRIIKVKFDYDVGFVNFPMYTGIYINELQSLSAIDEQNYIIVSKQSPSIMYTSNAGLSWEIKLLELGDARINGVKGFTNDEIFIAGNFYWIEKDSSGAKIYYPGSLFYNIDNHGNIKEDKIVGIQGNTIDFQFANQNIGGMSTLFGLHLTKDGGKSWEFIRRPIPPISVIEMEMPDPGIIMLLEHYVKSDSCRITLSEDFGLSWNTKSCPVKFTSFKAINRKTVLASYTDFVNDTTIVPHIYISKDACDTWEELDFGGFTFKHTNDDSFVYNMDGSKVIIVFGSYYGKILTSEDYGVTWESTDLELNPSVNLAVQQIEFVNHKPIIMFANNLLLVSNDISGVSDAEEPSSKNSMYIYPNPAGKEITIESEDFVFNNVKIYSTDGKLMLDAGSYANNQSINVESLPMGTYYIVCTDESGRSVSQMLNIVR